MAHSAVMGLNRWVSSASSKPQSHTPAFNAAQYMLVPSLYSVMRPAYLDRASRLLPVRR